MTAIGQSDRRFAPKHRGSGMERSLKIWGIIFLSPWIIGFFAFTFLPMVASLLFSFTDFNLLRPNDVQFIGWANYNRLFSDPQVAAASGATLRYALVALPVAIFAPIGMAALLNSHNLVLRRVYTTLFYMPYMVPVVSAVFIWQGFLNPQSGWLNQFLASIGITGPDWINSVDWIYPALVLISLWATGNAMLPTLAGMQGVPTELYEAAKVDGANAWVRFRRITFPMISPVIFYNLILTVIGLFRYFDIPYILGRGQGNPGGATNLYNVYIYRNAFTYQDMGYASTLAWVLFVVAMIVTLILFVSARFWVYYGGERN
ncbi:MAG TPA: sugar ABC transporter permease [Oceanobacillus sp.]|nr:sugar ABC transporter permease [Oceanobacillus sp.]